MTEIPTLRSLKNQGMAEISTLRSLKDQGMTEISTIRNLKDPGMTDISHGEDSFKKKYLNIYFLARYSFCNPTFCQKFVKQINLL